MFSYLSVVQTEGFVKSESNNLKRVVDDGQKNFYHALKQHYVISGAS